VAGIAAWYRYSREWKTLNPCFHKYFEIYLLLLWVFSTVDPHDVEEHCMFFSCFGFGEVEDLDDLKGGGACLQVG
jgi:hypothetical protein